MIILKNADSVEHIWAGQYLDISTQIEVDNEYFRLNLINNNEFLQDLEDGKAVINNGIHDLDYTMGLLCLKKQIKTSHIPVEFIGVIGESSPELVILNGAVFGYKFDIGNIIYVHKHLDNFVSPHVTLQLHLAIDNTEVNRWVKFGCHILTTTGIEDKTLNTEDIYLEFDSKEIPTDSLLIFDMKKELPISLFQNEEDNIFIGIERIEIESGKIAPINNPNLIRVDILFNQRLDI
jgi:hypothetical protein